MATELKVSETKVRNETRWLVDLRSVKGGREYFKTKGAAEKYLAELLDEKEKFGQIAIELPLETRSRLLACDARAARLGTTIEEALDWFEKTHKPSVRKRVGEAVKDCLEAKRKANKRPRYIQQLGYTLDSLRDAVGETTVCSDVTTEQVEAWLANPDWKSPKTRHNRLIDARTFFSFCRKRSWAPMDPAAAIEEIQLDEKPPGILSIPQCKRLLEACREKESTFLAWLVLALFCGIRPTEELRKLTWDQVNLKTGYVEIPAWIAKGRYRRLIKIQPNAVKWLEVAKELKGQLPIVGYPDKFAEVRHSAGFEVAVERKRELVRPENGEPWPHDGLRHSFCSYSLPEFGAAKTSEWAGHSESMLFECYRELVTAEAAKEFWSLIP